MKFKRSDSDSKPLPKGARAPKARPKRFQIIKRKPKVAIFDWAEDKQWLWAAYRHGKGGFEDQTFPEGLSQQEFDRIANEALQSMDYPYILKAHMPERGVTPVGFARIDIVRHHVEPHIYWFWWATPRNKYEATFKFFDKLSEDAPFVIAVELGSEAFRMAEHLKAARVMSRIGTSHNWEPNKVMALYETRDG